MSRFATSSELLLWYPGLSTFSAPLIDMALEQAKCFFDTDAWGCHLLMGHIHATAHTLLLQQRFATGDGSGIEAGGTGLISSMTQGPVSISYAVPSSATDSASWGTTGAGLQYLALMGTLGPQAFLLQGGCCDDWWADTNIPKSGCC